MISKNISDKTGLVRNENLIHLSGFCSRSYNKTSSIPVKALTQSVRLKYIRKVHNNHYFFLMSENIFVCICMVFIKILQCSRFQLYIRVFSVIVYFRMVNIYVVHISKKDCFHNNYLSYKSFLYPYMFFYFVTKNEGTL